MDAVAQNGRAPIQDAEIIDAVQRRIDQRQVRVVELETELVEQRAQLKRDERVITLLRGEPTTVTGAKRGPKPKPKTPELGGTQVGDELLIRIETAIRRYAEDHEEFRQVDIRTMPDPPSTSSGALATAFEKLRERNVIRLVRKQGNNKIFRLTPGALAEQQS